MSYGPKDATFVSARHKLARAKWFIHCLEESTTEWINQNPARVIHEIDPADGVETVKLIAPMLPVEIPLACGEILHHLRGALDHSVSFMIAQVTGKMDHRVNFPVCKSKQTFERFRNHQVPSRRHELFINLPKIWQIIEKDYRPYSTDGGNHFLWAISQLNNFDKHRILVATTSVSASRSDLARPGFRGNLSVLVGPGEMVLGRGRNLGLETPNRQELILREPSVLPDTELFAFLKASHRLVFDIVGGLESHFFESSAA